VVIMKGPVTNFVMTMGLVHFRFRLVPIPVRDSTSIVHLKTLYQQYRSSRIRNRMIMNNEQERMRKNEAGGALNVVLCHLRRTKSKSFSRDSNPGTAQIQS
jgi:hypothetical protein